jgi:hypothetical protein
MEHWLLVIQLSSGTVIPVQDFFTERECLKVLHQWTFEKERVVGDCVQVQSVPKKKK